MTTTMMMPNLSEPFLPQDLLCDMPLFDGLEGMQLPEERVSWDSVSPPDSPCYSTDLSDAASSQDFFLATPLTDVAPMMWGDSGADDFLASAVSWEADMAGVDELGELSLAFGEPVSLPDLAAVAPVVPAATSARVPKPCNTATVVGPTETYVLPPRDPAEVQAALTAAVMVADAAAAQQYDLACYGKTKKQRRFAGHAQQRRPSSLDLQLARLPRDDPEAKRHTHNILERKRRNDLKLSYQQLREQIPVLEDNDRAPTGQILLHAVEYIRQLKAEEARFLESLAVARAENERLRQFHGTA